MNFYTLTVLQKWKKTFGVVLFRKILRIYSSKGMKDEELRKDEVPFRILQKMNLNFKWTFLDVYAE